MKAIIKYFICLLAGIGMYACDYLDIVPDQTPTLDHAFADRYAAERVLASCYWAMPQLGNRSSNPAFVGAMEMVLNRELQTDDGMKLALGLNTPQSPIMNFWSSRSGGNRSLYVGINDCNVFLDNFEKVNDLDRQEKDRWIAEVKLIKAYMHFYLIRCYGPIAPLKENFPVGEASDAIKVYREKVDDSFAYIIELIDEVINSKALPLIIGARGTDLGRFTEAAAYMLKARVLVSWASPFFNGNTDYNNFRDHNGEPFFNQQMDPTRWTRATEACLQAIEVCNKADIRLYDLVDHNSDLSTISDTTRRVNMLRSAVTFIFPVELIWGNTSTSKTIPQRDCMPRLESGTANMTGVLSVPFSTVDIFYSDHGVPVGEDTAWINSGRYANRFQQQTRTGDEAHKYYIREGQTTADMNFDREPRFYSSLGFDRGLWYGNTPNSVVADDSKALYPSHRWGEYSSNTLVNANASNCTGYWPKKLVQLGSQIRERNGDWYGQSYAYPDMRFADLLLLTAEALNETAAGETSQPAPEVYQYIDQVRTRAGLEGVVESWYKYSTHPNKPLTKAGMREIIRQERKIELAFEGQYYWDVRRWKTAPQELNRTIQGWTTAAADLAYYNAYPLYSQKFTFRDYLLPIPDDDIIKNPHLVQNPGY
jgi:hypothetical protein